MPQRKRKQYAMRIIVQPDKNGVYKARQVGNRDRTIRGIAQDPLGAIGDLMCHLPNIWTNFRSSRRRKTSKPPTIDPFDDESRFRGSDDEVGD